MVSNDAWPDSLCNFNLSIFLQTNVFVTLLLVGLHGPSLAQLTPSHPDWERFTKRTYVAGNDTLRYRLLYPLN
ncbi:hypothetical protein CLV58_113113 [Spirosoma oryzae]|uniref:Uncharacterized protein n=1 Tax=Spirosoma oryzae TaxID=1469603 RepID=A0A2T0SRD8_9BACT|nr:hypothetical protein CLV58_113113 [Spirosoma oryzae]